MNYNRLLSLFISSHSCIFIVVITLIVLIHPAAANPAFPLKIGTSQRYLVDQENIPFLINGDTPWSLITGLTNQDLDIYLEDRRTKGFNAVLVNLIEHEFNGPVNQEGELPFVKKGDFSTPNEAYFKHADWVINKAFEKGIVVFLTPAYIGYGCGSQGWCEEMIANGPEKMREYGRWIGKRYHSFPNIVWVAGGDFDAHKLSGAYEAMNAMVEGIKETDLVHPFTSHCDRGSSAMDCYNSVWLDINNTYSDCNNTARRSLNDYNRSPIKPFFYIEGIYEGEGASEVCVRSQAYWSILSGSTGHFYGNNPIWFFKSGWKNALNAPGGSSLTYLYNLFLSRSWYLLVPDQTHQVLTAGYMNIGSVDYASAALTSDNHTFIVYLPSRRKITVNLSRLSGVSSRAWWFNPRNGNAQLIGEFTNNTSVDYTPPSSGDWVLVVDDASLHLSTPGVISSSHLLPPNIFRIDVNPIP